MNYVAPIKDMQFVLNELAGLKQIQALPGCEDATDETVAAVLEENARFMGEVVAPLNRTGDVEPARWDNGRVITVTAGKFGDRLVRNTDPAPAHGLVPRDDVLDVAGEQVAVVRQAVGERRTVVQHEHRAALRDVADLRVQALGLPARQRVRFALRQVAAHRERGLRQQDGGLVGILLLVGFIGHGLLLEL